MRPPALPNSPAAARRLLCCAALALLAGCVMRPNASPAPAVLEVVVVRHAEKAVDDPRDPSLSAAGQARALRLAGLPETRGLAAIYSSNYRRTRDTAAAVAGNTGLAVTLYDAAEPAAAFVARLHASHPAGRVLVVGHSNTVPAIVAALCACAVEAISDDDYGQLFEIRLAPGAAPSLRHWRY